MIPTLDAKAYAAKTFFNLWGRLGGGLLNYGCLKSLNVERDLSYGPEAEQRLDIFRPLTTQPALRPVLIYFHGGGWISADKRIYDGIAANLTRNGFMTFNVNYRLAPAARFPAPLQDAVHAIDWIYHNLERFGGDPSAVVLAGDSAGAQIASWYACALRKKHLFEMIGVKEPSNRVPIKGLLLFYGVFDFDTVLQAPLPFIKLYAHSFLGSDPERYTANSQIASPIKHVVPGLPPVFLCAGQRDGLFSQSVAFAEVLDSAGTPYRKLFFGEGVRANHGFLFFKWLKSSRRALSETTEFLEDLVRP